MKKKTFKDAIIYEDQQYLVLNKWPGISTLSDRHAETCLLTLARRHYPEATVCHRLDKETSGVLVFAKDQAAYRFLSLQFQNRSVEKIYHALVEGRHDFRDKNINLPLHIGRRGHTRVSHASGKESSTLLNTIEQYQAHTLVRCEPLTGRTHQIRAHLSAIGSSIVGDLAYGGQELFLSNLKRNYNLRKDTAERPLMSRPALHAQELRFQLTPEKRLAFEAEYPKDFRATLNQLGKFKAFSHS